MAKYGGMTMIFGVLAVLIVLYFLTLPSAEGFQDGGDDSTESFTMYYVDWCPHCVRTKPVFNEFMGNGTVLVNGKAVKCRMINAEKNPEAVKGLNLKGYPSFLLTTNGKLVEFEGPRTADGFMEFLKTNILSN